MKCMKTQRKMEDIGSVPSVLQKLDLNEIKHELEEDGNAAIDF